MSDKNAPTMDYAEHERTYEGFLKFSKIASIGIGCVLWSLVLFAFGGGLGTFLGTITLIGALIAAIIGLFSKGEGWLPSAIVFGAAMVFVLVSTL